MEKTNENGELSRGEKRLNSESEHQNNLENAGLNSENQNSPESTYHAENPELDALINDAVTTKAEIRQEEQQQRAEQKAQAKLVISDEQACGYALMGLSELQAMLSQKTGKQIQIGQGASMMVSALFAPLIQKYGRYFMEMKPGEVDLDSWKPEMMAAGGLAVAAGAAWLSFRNAPDLPKEDKSGGDNGDKSK